MPRRFIDVNTDGLKSLAKELKGAPAPVMREFYLEINTTARGIKGSYRRNSRTHFISGDFDRSIAAVKVGKGSYEIGSDLEYAYYLEVGTKPHLIPLTPKTDLDEKPFLVFWWPKVGELVFSRQVQHPGTDAYNLLFKAWVEWMEPFTQTFGERLRVRLKRMREV